VGIAGTPDGGGYWLADSLGEVISNGDATFLGSMQNQPLNSPIAHIVAAPELAKSANQGYWLVAADGGVFAFGDAHFYGSMGGQHLNAPIVGLSPTGDGRGYWLVGADGGVFAFGDAVFRGSMAGLRLNKPIVGIGGCANDGYWEVASDGGVFAIGVPFLGSASGLALTLPVNGIVVNSSCSGYWLAAFDGGVFTFGYAGFFGSLAGQPLSAPIVGIATDLTTAGYWLVGSDGVVHGFNASTGRPLPVTVTSVTATTTPYDPTRAPAGYPAEQVDFTVGGSPSGQITCPIEVLHGGVVVGSTVARIGLPAGSPSAVQKSVTVNVSGDNFNGNPSDAQVACYTP
jgi:hypothetical protein